MNRIEKLLQKFCPDGVEFKDLGEICDALPKGTLKQQQLQNEGYPVINSGRELYGYYSQFNNEGNAIVITSHGAYAGFTHYLQGKFWAGGLCYPYRSKNENELLTKFIFYYCKDKNKIIKSFVAEGSIPYINKSLLDKLKIPIPPLEIQKEIVLILDAFTELEAELEARRKQYEHYRERLLSFDELERRARLCASLRASVASAAIQSKNIDCHEANASRNDEPMPLVKMMSLGEVGEFVRGNWLTKERFCRIWRAVHSLWANLYLLWHFHTPNQKFCKRSSGKKVEKS